MKVIAMKVKFTILGEPKGKQRPMVTRAGVAYTPKDTVQYENLVRVEYRRQCNDYRFPDDSPLDLRITAYYGIPKSASKKKRQQMADFQIRPLKKSDWDNIGKIIADSLNEVAYKDDVQIVDAQVRKFYSNRPRVVVTIQDAKI